MQVGQLPEFARLSACGKKESQWRCWVPPAMRKWRLIYAASSSAYGDAQRFRRGEDMAFNPPITWKPPAKPVAMQN